MAARFAASPSGDLGDPRPLPPLATSEVLTRYRRLMEPALRQAVTSLHPWGAHMAAFTLGWSDIDGTPLDEHGGKSLRPALAMLCAQAAGSPPDSAVPGALAVELVHAFSLVHDDIIDSDERRRHRDAVWKAFGVGPAVLTGDALLALAISRLAATDNSIAMGYLSRALVELVHGQTEDMAFENRPWNGDDAVTAEEYSGMAARKTGALLGCAAAVGTALGGGSAAQAERMYGMGRSLGLAYQMVDDLLGIWGDPAVTGKPVYSDLRAGKKTLPVLAALAADDPAAGKLEDLLLTGDLDDDTVRLAADLIEAAGGADVTRELAARHAGLAVEALGACFPGAAELHELRDLCELIVNRSH